MTTVAVLTAKGRDMVTSSLLTTALSPKVIAWGTNPKTVTASAVDIGMFTESAETRVTGTASVITTTTTNDTYQVVGTITSSSTQTIAEVAVMDSTTKPFSTTWATAPTTTTGTTGTTAASYTPANGTTIETANGEVMTVSGGTGTTSVTVVRGANGSTAATQTAADVITQGAVPGTTTPTGGQSLMHATFTGLALNSGDSIAFTCQVKFT